MAQWYARMVYTPDTSRLTEEGIDADRRRYEAMLDGFEAQLKANPALANDTAGFNFYPQEPPHFLLSYQHRNNAHLFSRVSDVYRLMFPAVNYVAPHAVESKERITPTKTPPPATTTQPTKQPSTTTQPIKQPTPTTQPTKRFTRVAFVSGRMSKLSSVMKDRLGVIQKLDRARFTVALVMFAQPQDEFGRKAVASADEVYICEDDDFVKTRDYLASLLFDVVVYCELSFGPRTYALAHCRLAPVQVTTWGHSDTSGIATIDHYISSALYEVPDFAEAQSHYSERLILHKSLCTYYFRPFLSDVARSFQPRDHFYLPQGATVYLLIQTPFKIVNEFLLVVADILKADPRGVLVMTSHPMDPGPGRNNYRTLQSVLPPEAMARVRVMPWLKYLEGQNLIAVADVLLDSYPFGGCNTTIESLHLGRPTVTLPAKFLYGRFSAGFYTHIGITELIATDFEDYKRIALRLGRDPAYRQTMSARIRAAAARLFEDAESVREWEATLTDLAPPRVLDARPALCFARGAAEFVRGLRAAGLDKAFLFDGSLLRHVKGCGAQGCGGGTTQGTPCKTLTLTDADGDSSAGFHVAHLASGLKVPLESLRDVLQAHLVPRGFVRSTALVCGAHCGLFVYACDRMPFTLAVVDDVSQRKCWTACGWVASKLVFAKFGDAAPSASSSSAPLLESAAWEVRGKGDDGADGRDEEVLTIPVQVPKKPLPLLLARYGPAWECAWENASVPHAWEWDPLRSPRNLFFPVVYVFCPEGWVPSSHPPSQPHSHTYSQPQPSPAECLRQLKRMVGAARQRGDRVRVLADGAAVPVGDASEWVRKQGAGMPLGKLAFKAFGPHWGRAQWKDMVGKEMAAHNPEWALVLAPPSFDNPEEVFPGTAFVVECFLG